MSRKRRASEDVYHGETQETQVMPLQQRNKPRAGRTILFLLALIGALRIAPLSEFTKVQAQSSYQIVHMRKGEKKTAEVDGFGA